MVEGTHLLSQKQAPLDDLGRLVPILGARIGLSQGGAGGGTWRFG